MQSRLANYYAPALGVCVQLVFLAYHDLCGKSFYQGAGELTCIIIIIVIVSLEKLQSFGFKHY